MIGSLQTRTLRSVQRLILKCRQSPLTWILLLLIWAVEIYARFVADSKMTFNEVMGIEFIEPWTYITYALAHEDMGHILGNSVFLLFGMKVESHYGGKAFLGIVGFSIIFGAFGALAFYLVSDELSDGPMIGASAISLALLIAGISAIVQDGEQSTPIGVRGWLWYSFQWFLFVAALSGMAILANGADFAVSLGGAVAVAVIVAPAVVGLRAVLNQVQCWELGEPSDIGLRIVQAARCFLIPVLLFAALVYGEITGTTEWFYGNSGHAGGAVVGLIASLWANGLSWHRQVRCVRAEATATPTPSVPITIGYTYIVAFLILGLGSAWGLLLLAWQWFSV